MGQVCRRGNWALAVSLSVVLAATPSTAALQAGASADESSFWTDAGLGVTAALGSIVYAPIKLVYATVGGVVGVLAYVVTLGSSETANAIWEPTMGGNYVLTPGILAGDEEFHFNGQPPAPPRDPSFTEHDTQWAQ